MIEDPVVEEVHRTRERLLQEYGAELPEQWRKIEDEFRDRVVRLEPRPPVMRTRKTS